jgi:hypothetical protein
MFIAKRRFRGVLAVVAGTVTSVALVTATAAPSEALGEYPAMVTIGGPEEGTITMGGGGAGAGAADLVMNCYQGNSALTTRVTVRAMPGNMPDGFWVRGAIWWRNITYGTQNPGDWHLMRRQAPTFVHRTGYLPDLDNVRFGRAGHKYEVILVLRYAPPGGYWSAKQIARANVWQYDRGGWLVSDPQWGSYHGMICAT